MKKRMALLMAAIMALSPVSAFASTANSMDGTITTTKKKTVLMEKNWMNKASSNGRDIYTLSSNAKSDDIEFVVQGSDLLIKSTTDQIKAGDTFEVRLTNSEWAFANADKSYVNINTNQQNSLTVSETSIEKNLYENIATYFNTAVIAYGSNDGTTNPAPLVPTVLGAPAQGPGGKFLADGAAAIDPVTIGETAWTASTTTVPADYADAVKLWKLAEEQVKAEYALQKFRTTNYLNIFDELEEHDNTVNYGSSFKGLYDAGQSSDSRQYKFDSDALPEIRLQGDAGSQNTFVESTFDKSLGMYTTYDADAYLRFGSATASTVGATKFGPGGTSVGFATGTTKETITDKVATLTFNKPGNGHQSAAAIKALAAFGALTLAYKDAYEAEAFEKLYENQELPYMMRFTGDSDPKVATVTVLRNSFNDSTTTINNCSYVRIPMVILAKDDGDAKVTVAPSNNSSVTGVTYTVGNASGSGKTTTTVEDIKVARSTFDLETFKITEDVIDTIRPGVFTLTAPYGYTWADPLKSNISMGSSGGLRYVENSKGAPQGVVSSISNGTAGDFVKYAVNTDGSNNKQKLVFNLTDDTSVSKYGIYRFNSVAGTLYIENLTLLAEDYAPFDKDVLVKIKSGTPDAKISEQDVKVATRKDWVISLTASQPVPTLVNGRFAVSAFADSNGATKTMFNATDDFDGWHKTSKVTFKENVEASWWEERETVLTLPEGVKFIQAKINDANPDNEFIFYNGLKLNDTYDAVAMKGTRNGHVKLTGNTLTLTDLSLRANKKAEFTIESWVSIESGFEGDITMTAGGTGVPYEVAPVVIAKAVSPITIDTEVTDVKIGYQWQKVADFTVNETGAGRLLKDKTIVMSIDDSISNDEIFFAPDSVVEKSGNISFTKPSVNKGHIELTIDRESNGTASAIKFSNVYVKIDRTVPESNNHPYKILAEGNAIAANYVGEFREKTNYASYEPLFSTRGIGADYLNVVTAATDKPGVLSNTVRVAVGSDVVLVGRDNPVEIQMDTAAYISAESESTMVPVRFVSVALGIPEGQIVWDNENRTVTINYTNTTVQMKAGSDQLTINGVTTTMYSPNVPPKKVTVEMKDNRSFLPFRQLGYALGVPVAWDPELRVATYNAPEDLNTSSSAVATTDAE